VLREDYGAETYWRVFLRARFQDGTQGRPLPGLPWDLAARAGGDPRAYEQGGALAAIVPGGYWIDFTALAAAYGWERLPALTAWRSAYGAVRYNEFVLTDGLDWASAMLELYPPEALLTPTAIFPPTHAPTPLPPSTHTPTAAPLIPTPLPTATPAGSTATAEPPPAAPTAPP
jgi:TolB protein